MSRLPSPPILGPGDRWALFLDVDGTLLEIAPTPDAVKVDEGLLDLLLDLNAALGGALALISGRSIADLDAILHHPELAMAGQHGAERRLADGTIETAQTADLGEARRTLEDFVGSRPGLMLEDKGRALALHYRGAPEHEGAVREVMGGVTASSPDFKLVEGKMVAELKSGAFDKGISVTGFLQTDPFRDRRPVFVGDDVTDEDGFAAVNGLGGLSVLVGQREGTHARYSLADVGAVHGWLNDLRRALKKENERA